MCGLHELRADRRLRRLLRPYLPPEPLPSWFWKRVRKPPAGRPVGNASDAADPLGPSATGDAVPTLVRNALDALGQYHVTELSARDRRQFVALLDRAYRSEAGFTAPLLPDRKAPFSP